MWSSRLAGAGIATLMKPPLAEPITELCARSEQLSACDPAPTIEQSDDFNRRRNGRIDHPVRQWGSSRFDVDADPADRLGGLKPKKLRQENLAARGGFWWYHGANSNGQDGNHRTGVCVH